MEPLPLPPDEPRVRVETKPNQITSRSTATSPLTISFQGDRNSLWSRASPFVLVLLIGALMGGSVVNYAHRRATQEREFSAEPVRRDRDRPYNLKRKTPEPEATVTKKAPRRTTPAKRTRKAWLAN